MCQARGEIWKQSTVEHTLGAPLCHSTWAVVGLFGKLLFQQS